MTTSSRSEANHYTVMCAYIRREPLGHPEWEGWMCQTNDFANFHSCDDSVLVEHSSPLQ
jgi:hypothetical protein